MNVGAPLGVAYVALYIGDAAKVAGTGGAALPLDDWVHIATTHNGSSLSFYTNGVLAGSASASGAADSSTAHMNVGARSGGVNMKGFVDEILYYTNALSADDIADLYGY